MSYDVIETYVVGPKDLNSDTWSTAKENLQMASLIQHEGELQFTRYLPLERAQSVEPFFDDLRRYVGDFIRCAERIQKDFIRCGYFLNLIKRNGLYRYCVQEGLKGYTNFYNFCEDKLGVPATTAKRLIAINERFCANEAELPRAYEGYGSSKLAIMATFQNGLEGKLTRSVTVKELQKLSKYYSSHEWEVNRDTSWKDDLAAYENEIVQKRMMERSYLRRHEFEPAPSKKPKKGLISDEYKAFTKFFDQTLEELSVLRQAKNKRYEAMLTDLEETLRRMQSIVLTDEGDELLEGL